MHIFDIMSTLEEIKKVLAQNRVALFSKYPLESMAIFGSVSREETDYDSDVDILVAFNSPIGIGFIKLANELEHYLGRKVDLVSRGGIKEYYFDAIKSDLIYV